MIEIIYKIIWNCQIDIYFLTRQQQWSDETKVNNWW